MSTYDGGTSCAHTNPTLNTSSTMSAIMRENLNGVDAWHEQSAKIEKMCAEISSSASLSLADAAFEIAGSTATRDVRSQADVALETIFDGDW